MGDIGIPELLFILAIALLIFGPKKLGDLGKGLGEGIRGFRSALGGEPENAKPTEATPAAPTAALPSAESPAATAPVEPPAAPAEPPKEHVNS